ncbi:MAG: hypothetical protein ABW048_05580 [Sphingobium sp.]
MTNPKSKTDIAPIWRPLLLSAAGLGSLLLAPDLAAASIAADDAMSGAVYASAGANEGLVGAAGAEGDVTASDADASAREATAVTDRRRDGHAQHGSIPLSVTGRSRI